MDRDTSPAASARYAELLRKAGPGQRLRITIGLSRSTRALAEAGIRARAPHASERRVARELTALLYGEGAAARLFGPASDDER